MFAACVGVDDYKKIAKSQIVDKTKMHSYFIEHSKIKEDSKLLFDLMAQKENIVFQRYQDVM
jgi:hypothetical protein